MRRRARRRQRRQRPRHGRVPDARPRLDPVRAVRRPDVRSAHGRTLRRLRRLYQNADSRRGPAAAAGELRDGPGRQGPRPRPRRLHRGGHDRADRAVPGRQGRSPTTGPIPDKPADFYVSFDNEAIGEAIAQSLVDHLKESSAEGGLLQVNGSPTDAAAGLIKNGIHNAIDASGYDLLAEYDTPEWSPDEGPGLGERPDHAVRRPDRRRRRRQRRHRRRRDRRVQGRRRDLSRRSPATTPSSPRSSASSPATSTTPSPSRSRSSPRPPPTCLQVPAGRAAGGADHALRHPVAAVHAHRRHRRRTSRTCSSAPKASSRSKTSAPPNTPKPARASASRKRRPCERKSST